MTCDRSQELLALYAGGDLTGSQADAVDSHLKSCSGCQEFADRLGENQALLRSLRPKVVPPSMLTDLRSGIMSRVSQGQQVLGWRVQLERYLMLGFRKPLYAVAAIGAIAILSVTLFAQMQRIEPSAAACVAVFQGSETLVRPEGYREWVFVGSSMGHGHPQDPQASGDLFRNIYINPDAYREYAKTGKFPEGTVMVLESARAEVRDTRSQSSYETEFVALKTSVKDSRFPGGWGYFDFTDGKGGTMATALPEDNSCISCHQAQAETDHVFTQFYPVLRSVSGVL